MDKKNILNLLEQRGYDSRSAQLVIDDLLQLCSPLNEYFEAWLNEESFSQDYAKNGYSLLGLMSERKMTYPAALLTIDWVIKDPNAAIKSLNRGIK